VAEATIQDLIDLLCRSFQSDRSAGFEATIQIHLTGEQGGDWLVVIEEESCKANPGVIENPRLKIEASAEDVLDMYNGKLDPMRAFMQGKLKLTGDKAMALKMITLFKVER
jgi:putative sterol carrier protein